MPEWLLRWWRGRGPPRTPAPRRRVPGARDLLRAAARAQADIWAEKARAAREGREYNEED